MADFCVENPHMNKLSGKKHQKNETKNYELSFGQQKYHTIASVSLLRVVFK